jgi:hypothetical protein
VRGHRRGRPRGWGRRRRWLLDHDDGNGHVDFGPHASLLGAAQDGNHGTVASRTTAVLLMA